jgi:hypothetical protein
VLRRPLAIAALLWVLALPAAASAQNPFGPLPQAQQPTQTATTNTGSSTSTSDNGGLKTWQEILIFGAGLVLLMGIGFAIVGDARDRAARLARRRGRAETAAAGVPHKHRQQSKQRARAKARAAKAQRRKNR